jgi:Uri superfamily endonuclease
MKGSYILLIEIDQDKDIQIGGMGKMYFEKGFYVYIGSALNSLEQRIERHISKHKRFHWHIDFLLNHAKVVEVHYKESLNREECEIADIFYDELVGIKNFGCSDCRCKSHLFYGDFSEIRGLINSINMRKYSFNANTYR